MARRAGVDESASSPNESTVVAQAPSMLAIVAPAVLCRADSTRNTP